MKPNVTHQVFAQSEHLEGLAGERWKGGGDRVREVQRQRRRGGGVRLWDRPAEH